ncbi:MAG: T9SS type A sorting domain-containing protein [Taibaiella sp.]|nr:T9SS type A sorting domain-containing protein [Taibaiella sp.]
MNKTFNHPKFNDRKRMFTVKLRALVMLFGGFTLAAGNTFAEGTKEISNNNSGTNSALLVYQSRGTGPFLNNIPENRIRVRIADYTQERIHFGFKWREYGTTGYAGDEIGANIWAVIYDPTGAIVSRQRFNSTVDGYISSFTQAVNGPNILGVSTGYKPITFTPTMNGEYAMVFYRVSGSGSDHTAIAANSSQEFKASFWDITVANATNKFTGRVFSQNWGLVAVGSNERVGATAKAAPAFYSYSNDSTLIKLSFASVTSGFAPVAYDIAFTDYGVNNNLTDWSLARNSVEAGTTNMVLTDGFKVFLNEPSAVLYPIATINGTPAFSAVPITGCPGSNLTANFTMPEAGDVRIVFDIDGNGDGFTPNTRDFVLEGFDMAKGPGTITWDGKDGLGNNLVAGTAISISATYRRGRFNLPIYDAEVNADGMYIQTIAPLSSPSNRLYWNDSKLPNNVTTTSCSDNNANVSGKGLDNSLYGTMSSANSPTRAWNGNGNLGNVVPAPSVSRGGTSNDQNGDQCDDYGNVRVLNTWGWALEADGQQTNVTFGCFNIAGNVFNDVNSKNNNLIDQSATNPLALPVLYAYIVSSDSVIRSVTTVNANGTYSFTNIPGANYNVVISTTQVAVNSKLNYATQVTLPAGWNNVGEQLGTTAGTGIDAIADGILPLVLNGNKTGVNFGIQRLPVPGSGANSAANPGGTAQVTVPGSTFTNTTVSSDYDGGTITGIRIVSFPANTTTIVINGNSYNSTTWPAAGVLVPANASGVPTQTITVDPDFEGPGSIMIPFKSVDNAGQVSTANGAATLTFGANITGRVWNDANGDATGNNLEKPVSGDRTNSNAGSVNAGTDFFANLTGSNNRVIASVRVNADGTYAFTNMPTGLAYKVVLTSGNIAPVANSLLTAGSNAAGWVATGVNMNGTANTSNTTNVADLGMVTENKVNNNFGIQRTPTADPKSYNVSNNSFGYAASSGSLSGFPTLVGYAYIQMSNAAVGPLTGTDPEDCANASSCSAGSSFSIHSINNRTKLYYNFGGTTGVKEVVAGTPTARIDNFDPANMVIYAQSGGGTATTPFAFTYSITDKANATSPAVTYEITTVTPLPVSLVDFSATANDRNVSLNWSTLFESNNKGFVIERSFDARSWQELGFVASKAANGRSSQQLDYSTTDKNVNPGNVYYRLKQLDHDGVFTLSDVRMVNIKSAGLSIYPNPANKAVNVIGLAAKHTVSVFDVTGRVVMTADLDATNNTLNVASLTNGVYTVVLQNENGVAGTFKLVKN